MNKLIDLVLIHLNEKDIYSRLNRYSGLNVFNLIRRNAKRLFSQNVDIYKL